MRTIEWDFENECVRMIDQRVLPRRFEVLNVDALENMVEAIRDMAIRGAPALAVAAAFGIALALKGQKMGARLVAQKAGQELIKRVRRRSTWVGASRILKVVNDPASRKRRSPNACCKRR
jgi:methylthioribose-1-phosphate isomerase